VLTSQLTARVRAQADAARRPRAAAPRRSTPSRAPSPAPNGSTTWRVVLTSTSPAAAHGVALLLPESGRLAVRATSPAGVTLTDGERAAARGCSSTTGRPDAARARSPATSTCTAAQHRRGAVGVLSIHAGDGDWMPLDQRQLVESITHQAAVAIERMRVDVVEAVIESIEDGLVVLSPDGVVEQMNEVACAISTSSARSAQGARFRARHEPPAIPAPAGGGRRHSRPSRARGRAGRVRDVPARPEHFYVLRPHLRSARSTPRRPGSCYVLQDVTYLARQERAASSSWRRCRPSSRTPLTSLAWRRELLRAREASSTPRRIASSTPCTKDVLRLEDVAQRLLDVSRVPRDEYRARAHAVDLKAIVARVGRLFALQAR
jgi:K+-sensing histidine kinase KdpD